MTLPLVILFVGLNLLIVNNQVEPFIKEIRTDKKLLKWLGAYSVLYVFRNSMGLLSQGLFTLVFVSSIIDMMPSAIDNAVKK